MNYIEALQALVDGKKIRHKSWGKDVYRFIGADDKFYNDIEAQTSFMIYNKNEILSDSWEIYQTEEDRLITSGKKWEIYNTCRGVSCDTCKRHNFTFYRHCQKIGRDTLVDMLADNRLSDEDVDKLYNAVKGEIDA